MIVKSTESSASPLPDGAPALEVRQVSHRFGSHRALDGVSLTVPGGDLYGFLGLNGAGKSTALRLALGLLRLQQGSIRLLGQKVEGHPVALYRDVGFLMENYIPYPYLSARENLLIRARMLGLDRSTTRDRSETLLRKVHLQEVAGKKTRKFSMGMRRRLGVAVALLGSPRLLLLDEPTNGLDPQGIHDLRAILQEVSARGVTVVLSSHLLGEVELLCRRVGIIDRGKVLHEGRVEEITRSGSSKLLVRAQPPERVRAILSAASWCREIEPVPGEPDGLLVEVQPENVPRVASLLVEAGVEIHEIRRRERSLERFFRDVIEQARVGAGASLAAS